VKRGALALTSTVILALAVCHPSFHAGPLPGAPANETFADVDGVHVHYRDQGQGPAVVLIHGFGGSLEHWAGVAPAVAATHRVISLDLKGFGWTSRPEGDYSPAAQAQLVWHLLDKLGVTDTAIVGHSWGASVALSMAVAQPARTRRVALYSAYVYDEQVPGFFRWAQAGSHGGGALFTLFYKQRIEDRAPLAYYDERWVTQARVDRVEAELDRPGTTAAALATVRGHHFEALHDALTTFDKPVLLLWGAQDIVTPVSYGHRLAAELQNAEIVVYERCGHIPMVEARNPSTRRLLAFLDQDARQAQPLTAPAQPEPPATDGGAAPADAPSGGGASGGGSGTVSTSIDPADLQPPRRPTQPNLVRYDPLTFAGDLVASGAELVPRQYAAPREKTEVVVHGILRVRESGLYNLDLDRGLDPSGQPLFPVPLDPDAQLLEVGDIRARTDLAIYPRGVGVAVKARIDWLDNVSIGGTPDLRGGSPATTPGQRPSVATVKRAWGEVLTPIGTVVAGRTGVHFGLGILANSGDCEDCDHGDAGDRAAIITPLADHLFAFAYDIASRGPFTPAPDGGHNVLLEPSGSVSGPTFAMFKTHSPATLARRADAGMTTLEYAGYYTLRMQGNDVPASYLPAAVQPTTFTSADVVARDFRAHGAGGWFRISGASFRIEAELAYLHARVGQPSLIPGTEITVPVTSNQLGAALQSEVIAGKAMLGLDAGYASGDDAPGFGAFPTPGQLAPMPGAFEGAQANPPRDRTVDNFRFHPDFRIDQILFREIIGTITDAIYVRPHVRATLLTVGAGRVEARLALIASWAVEATSTPSGARGLGVEIDPELRYENKDGFVVTFAHGLLLPGAGFDGSALAAKPAQAFRVRAEFVF
jgi:uncharacterized protein (TIGR04551 family)